MASQNDPKDNVSQSELSHAAKKKMTDDLYFLQRYYKGILAFAIAMSIPVIIMSAFWADIQAKNDLYTDVSANWQSCLTTADYQILPLENIVNASTSAFGQCLAAQQPTCSQPCLYFISTNCVLSSNLHNVVLPTGKFLNSLSYIGIQSVIFTLVAHGNMFKALSNPSWLISAIGMMVWFAFSIFTYYAVSPVLPVPSQTNSTFLTFLIYEGNYDKYANLNGGDNDCLTAYRYVWVYLTFILMLAVSIVGGCAIGCYAEYIRYRSPNKKTYDHINFTEAPLALGALGIAFYLIVATSKMLSSFTELDSINDFNMSITEALQAGYTTYYTQTWFPFAQPSVDLTTLLGICACISVLRGYTTQSVTAFKLAAGTAAVYSFSSWPGLVGAYEFYFHHNFQNFDDCWQYFQGSSVQASFGYPDEDHAKSYCYSFRLALGGSTGLLFLMHCITVACAYVVFNNHSRGSFAHEKLDFQTAALEYAVSRQNSTTGFSRASSATGGIFNAISGAMLPRTNTNTGTENPMTSYMSQGVKDESKDQVAK